MTAIGKSLFVLFALCCAGCAGFAPTREGKAFKATIAAGIKVGMPAEEVRQFLKKTGLKMTEFTVPNAITASIRYKQRTFGYRVSLAAIRFDADNRVREIVFRVDETMGF